MSQAACRKLASMAALAERLSLKQFTPRLFPPFPTPLFGVPGGIGLPPFARVSLLPGVVVVPVVGLPPGVTVGVLETPGVGVSVGDAVVVGVVAGVDVSVGVTTAVGVSIGVAAGVDVAVGVTPAVGVFAGRVGEGVGEGDGVGEGEGVGEGIEGVMVTTGVGVREG